MWEPTTTDMHTEVASARRRLQSHYAHVPSLIRRYSGRRYSTDVTEYQEGDPDSFIYAYVSYTLPSLVFNNPRADIDYQRIAGFPVLASSMKVGLNTWIETVELVKTLQQLVYDMLFFRGVYMTTLIDPATMFAGRPDGDVGEFGLSMPILERIRPDRFLIDASCDTIETSRWLGHEYYLEQKELENHPLLKKGMSDKLGSLSTFQDYAKEPGPAFRRNHPGNRNQVRILSIWFREANIIRTYGTTDEGLEEIFDPYEYWGDPSGPYGTFDAYPVMNEPYPLSPILAVDDQAKSLQDHLRAASRSASRRKKVAFTDSANKRLANALKQSGDGEIWTVPGFSKSQLAEVEVGGVTDTQLAWINVLRDILDRDSGLNEVARGDVGSSNSATEASIAQAGLDTRLGYMQRQVERATATALRKIAWYLWHDDNVRFPLTIENEYTGEVTSAVFQGGEDPAQTGASWADFAVRVNPTSMTRTSAGAEQQRGMQVSEIVLNAANLAITNPIVRVRELTNYLGEKLNEENLADRFLDLSQVGKAMPLADNGMAPASGTPTASQAHTKGRSAQPAKAPKAGTPAPRAGMESITRASSEAQTQSAMVR